MAFFRLPSLPQFWCSITFLLLAPAAKGQLIHEGIEPPNPQEGAVQSVSETSLFIANPLTQTKAQTNTQLLRGKIGSFDFTPPETQILLDTDFRQWQLLAPSAVELRRLGWTSKSLFPGEQVEVEIDVLPGAGHRARLNKLTRANGAVLLTTLNQPVSTGFDAIPGGMYALDNEHADLQLSFNHLGFSDLRIRFERLNGDVLWNSQFPEGTRIQVSVDTSSLRSGSTALDDSLRTEPLFNVGNHPSIQFKSTALKLVKWGTLLIEGQLEIKGVSRPVVLEAVLNKQGVNPINQNTTVGISLTGTVNRSEWGLTEYLPMVADEIDISFQGEFILRAADIPSALPSLESTPIPDSAQDIYLKENTEAVFEDAIRAFDTTSDNDGQLGP